MVGLNLCFMHFMIIILVGAKDSYKMKPSQLIRFRRERGWSQQKMAESIGISRSSLVKYESLHESKQTPRSVDLACSCLAFHLPPFGG